MVLDKDAFFRDFQRFVLTHQGFEVITPTEPDEFTADAIRAHQPDLVVTEILLPGHNGLELIQELKAPPGLGSCRVVVFSVLHAESRALAAGADRFVQKPLMKDSFLTTVLDSMKDMDAERTWRESPKVQGDES